jgi:photosystem II stability/assembly factor-like uncharacterized protein
VGAAGDRPEPLPDPVPRRDERLGDGTGGVLHTSDGGDTWQPRPVAPEGTSYGRVQLIDAQHGFVSGYDAASYPTRFVLYATADGGQSWSQVPGPGASSFSFVSPTTGWVTSQVDGQSGVFRTRDGGATWTRLPLEYADHILFVDENRGWHTEFVDLYEEAIFSTEDGGDTWSAEPRRVGCCFSEFEAVGKSDVWFVGWGSPHDYYGESKVMTHDGGVTWTYSPPSGNDMALTAADFVDASHGWAVGYGGSIIHTDNGGLSWQVQRMALNDGGDRGYSDEPAFSDVSFIDEQTGWAVSPGLIWKTTTGGKP